MYEFVNHRVCFYGFAEWRFARKPQWDLWMRSFWQLIGICGAIHVCTYIQTKNQISCQFAIHDIGKFTHIEYVEIRFARERIQLNMFCLVLNALYAPQWAGAMIVAPAVSVCMHVDASRYV